MVRISSRSRTLMYLIYVTPSLACFRNGAETLRLSLATRPFSSFSVTQRKHKRYQNSCIQSGLVHSVKLPHCKCFPGLLSLIGHVENRACSIGIQESHIRNIVSLRLPEGNAITFLLFTFYIVFVAILVLIYLGILQNPLCSSSHVCVVGCQLVTVSVLKGVMTKQACIKRAFFPELFVTKTLMTAPDASRLSYKYNKWALKIVRRIWSKVLYDL
jgi:hypothetical protein